MSRRVSSRTLRCGASHAAGRYGDTRIGSKSERRAGSSASHCGFPVPDLIDYLPLLFADLLTSPTFRRTAVRENGRKEIIWVVEQSHLPVRRTLAQIGVPPVTFYRGYYLYQTGGPEVLEDRPPKPDRVWNRIPDEVREQIVQLALEGEGQPAIGSRAARTRCRHANWPCASPTPRAISCRRRCSHTKRGARCPGIGGRIKSESLPGWRRNA